MRNVAGLLRRSLWTRVERDHHQSDRDFRRRQVITAGTTLVGAGMLAWGLNVEPGSVWFYVATISLAAVWTIGALLSGPLHLGYVAGAGGRRRPVTEPVALGVALAGLFVVGALVVREIDVLAEPVDGVLDYFREGAGPLILVIAAVNGVAEELFFRGALYAAIPRPHQVAVTTVVYFLATLATGNVMLAFAALVLGVVVGLQRRASGGVLAGVLTHVTWSLLLLAILPVLFDEPGAS